MLKNQNPELEEDLIYTETVSSNKTEVLFLTLTAVFLFLFIWRERVVGLDTLAIIFLCFFALFVFYSLNYRKLLIQFTSDFLRLKFGVFTWTVPWNNIEHAHLDEISPMMRYGGAGIHFMMIDQRYRASFNFLEYPRVVVALKKKAGLVRDISFSTGKPDVILRLIDGVLSVVEFNSADETSFSDQ